MSGHLCNAVTFPLKTSYIIQRDISQKSMDSDRRNFKRSSGDDEDPLFKDAWSTLHSIVLQKLKVEKVLLNDYIM